MAFLNKGTWTIILRDEREATSPFEVVVRVFKKRHRRLRDASSTRSREPIHSRIRSRISRTPRDDWTRWSWRCSGPTGSPRTILSFANNINTHEGGTHEEGFRSALTKALNEFGRGRRTSSRRRTTTSQGEDVREGLTAVISVKVPEPQFEGQTKTKLGNTEIRSFVNKTINAEGPAPSGWSKQPGRVGRIGSSKRHLTAAQKARGQAARQGA